MDSTSTEDEEIGTEGPEYPEKSNATFALALGFVSIVCAVLSPWVCAPLVLIALLAGIGAWRVANRELRAIAEGRIDPSNGATAINGRAFGIIAVVPSIILIGIKVLGIAPLLFTDCLLPVD